MSFILTIDVLKSQISSLVLLEGFLDESGLFCFINLALELCHNFISNKLKNRCYVVNNTIVSLRYDNVVYVPTMFSFVDAFTRYIWIHLLKHKNDTLSSFKLFQSYARILFNTNIKTIQSYYCGELRPFIKYFIELDIMRRLTCPYASHQNGIVERKGKQIMEMGLTLLDHASLPIEIEITTLINNLLN